MLDEPLAGWHKMEIARLYGCLRFSYSKMTQRLEEKDDGFVNYGEYYAVREALKRLRGASST